MLTRRALAAPLIETRQADYRCREIFFANLAHQSCEQRWTPSDIEIRVRDAVMHAILCGTIGTSKSAYGLIEQGILSSLSVNRRHFQRFVNLRETVWESDKELCVFVMQRKAHMLIDIFRRHRNSAERYHVASPTSYVVYLNARLRNKNPFYL